MLTPYNRPMTLARKLTVQLTALVVAVALIAGAALVGLQRLNTTLVGVGNEYEQLRSVYEAGHYAATARTLVRANTDQRTIEEQHDAGRAALIRLSGLVTHDAERLVRVNAMVRNWRWIGDPSDDQIIDRLNQTLRDVSALAGEINAGIAADRAAAADQLDLTIAVVTTLAIGVLIAAILIGARLYRAVMRPLHALDDAMESAAEANFTQRIEPAAEAEFAQLAQRFNEMADRLDTLYRTLEDDVNTKSRALVRSERLAGVGYLAAGLAHEINNPLGIIGGYAEAALAKPDDTERAGKALRVIADEAFRCKQITGKLLSLARPTDAEPTPVDLAHVLHHAAELMRGLDAFAGHTVALDVADDLVVTGHASELTQVAINLLANALEATPPDGRVSVTAERRGPWARVAFTDTGRGMTADQLERIFEPFYTDAPNRAASASPGTGLGLAVTHAIVTQHAGRITATSEGEGAGATLTIELPLAPLPDGEGRGEGAKENDE